MRVYSRDRSAAGHRDKWWDIIWSFIFENFQEDVTKSLHDVGAIKYILEHIVCLCHGRVIYIFSNNICI